MYQSKFKGSGQIEFTEFVILASKFIVEEDEETLHKELKEAFRLYDKEGDWLLYTYGSNLYCVQIVIKLFWFIGNGYIPTTALKEILRELDDKLTNEELEGIVSEIDEDGSGIKHYINLYLKKTFCVNKNKNKFLILGTVDFNEFMEMMTG